MEDLKDIFFVILLCYLLEYFHIQFNISILNIFIFINIIGIYYVTKKMKINIVIEYN